jgi:hypothetical protein
VVANANRTQNIIGRCFLAAAVDDSNTARPIYDPSLAAPAPIRRLGAQFSEFARAWQPSTGMRAIVEFADAPLVFCPPRPFGRGGGGGP